MNQVALFPDSNVFLHCRPLAELDWSILGVDAVTIFASSTIQTEIDELKNDPRATRAKRARKANALLREVLRKPNEELEIRASKPRVVLRLSRALPSARTRRETLNFSRRDHQHIEEALAYVERATGERVIVVSDDTGVLLCARDHALELLEPPDQWRLEEKDESDALREEIKRLRRAEPDLKVALLYEGKETDRLSLRIPILKAVSEPVIAQILKDVMAEHPRVTRFDRNPGHTALERFAIHTQIGRRWQPATESEIAVYDAEYERWIARCKEQLSMVGRQFNEAPKAIDFDLRVGNASGTRPADRVLIHLEVREGCQLAVAEEIERSDSISENSIVAWPCELTFPAPPQVPSGKFVDIFAASSLRPDFNLDRFFAPTPTFSDPQAIVTREGGPASVIELACEDLRHGIEPQVVPCALIVPPSRPGHTTISCWLSAANASDRIVRHFKVDIEWFEQDAAEIAREWTIEGK